MTDFNEVPCPMPDCGGPLHLHWELTVPLVGSDLKGGIPPTPVDAWTGGWTVLCEEGHHVLLPAPPVCPCGLDQCTGACDDADVDRSDELRTFRRSDVERLRKLLTLLGTVDD